MKKLLILALIFSILLVGCVQEKRAEETRSGKSVTIEDLMGRKVTVKVPVERVVITFNVEEYLAVGGEEGSGGYYENSIRTWTGRLR